jgi:DnaJ-class molecular chaperone
MKIPFRCPVCNGQGDVPSGFYTAIGLNEWPVTNIAPEPCRTCNGTGMVVVEQDENFVYPASLDIDFAD